MESSAIEVPAGTGDVAAVAAKPTLRLRGYSVAETAASAAIAEVILRHGTAAGDPMLTAPMNLAADGYLPSPPMDVSCPNGIYVDRVGGNTTVILYVARA
jgi:hypothetical protein